MIIEEHAALFLSFSQLLKNLFAIARKMRRDDDVLVRSRINVQDKIACDKLWGDIFVDI
jgi:hypothetical protein